MSVNKLLTTMLYWLFITFIYMNIVMPGSYDFNIVAKKIIFIVFVVTFLFVRATFPKEMIVFIAQSLFLICCMAGYSFILGNQFGDILIFVLPMLFLVSAPILYSLRDSYSLDSYLKHILIAVLIISVVTLIIVALSDFYFNEIALFLQSLNSNYGLMFLPGSGVRVSVQTAPFMPAGFFIAYYYYRQTRQRKYLIASAVICTAIFFTKTVGIWIALMAGALILTIFFAKKIISALLPILIIFIALLLVVQVVIPKMQSDIEKLKSYDVKSQQVENGLGLFQDNVLMGAGLGHRLNLDERGDSSPIIEVLPVLILIDGGLVGFVIYLFIYFTPVIKFFASEIKPDAMVILIASHISIALAGFANPYFISGGTGLFFVVLILVFLRFYKYKSAESIIVGNI